MYNETQNGVATAPSKVEKEVSKELQNKQSEYSVVDLNDTVSIDLGSAHVVNFDLLGDYWTPETEGEEKRLLFTHIAQRQVESQFREGEIDILETAFFLEQNDKGDFAPICNASKKLVGAIRDFGIKKGAALCITYLGKKKNRSNSYFSDNWSIKPLKIR